MSDHVAPRSVKIDALNRALRTLYVGFGIDALALIGAGLLELLNQVDVSAPAFWTAAGVLVVKSVLSALGSYLLRLKVAPKPDPAPGVTT